MKLFDAVRYTLTTEWSDREVARITGAGATTVRRYRRIARAKRLTWEMLASKTPEEVLAEFNLPRRGRPRRVLPHWATVHQEMSSKGMTLQLLWEEYKRETPVNGLCYSHFSALYNSYLGTLPTVMRQAHTPGEAVQVDFSGVRLPYTDRSTGKSVMAELFLGSLPCSGLMFACCVTSQKVPDWVAAHVAMFDYFGGVPRLVVPDNLRSAVTTPGRTPVIQRTFDDCMRHYGAGVAPARPRKPRDKGSVEQAVKFAQQRIVARLRSHTFYSVDEINQAIKPLLEEANGRPMVKDGKSRRERFEAMERDALQSLPKTPYVYADWVTVERVPADYHVAVFGHDYSVPHHLVGKRIDARATANHIELFHHRQCVGRHSRGAPGGQTTLPSHRTAEHRAMAERSPTELKAWAAGVGPNMVRFFHKQLGRRDVMSGVKACLDLQKLAHSREQAIEAALQDAYDLGSPTVSTVQRLLANRARAKAPASPRHGNVKGARSYLGGVSC